MLRFRDLGVFGFEIGCFVFEIWVLRFRDLGASFSRFRGLRFRDLGVFGFEIGCFVFEIWVLRASVFVFKCFVFETTTFLWWVQNVEPADLGSAKRRKTPLCPTEGRGQECGAK